MAVDCDWFVAVEPVHTDHQRGIDLLDVIHVVLKPLMVPSLQERRGLSSLFPLDAALRNVF